MARPTAEELILISKFRTRLNDLALSEEQRSDMQLVRWIRAREHSLDQAENMFRKYIKWTDENDMSNISTWEPPELVAKLSPRDLSGYDNEGCPVLIVPAGRIDFKRIFQAGYLQETIRYADQAWEKAIEKMEGRLTKEGVPVTQITVIQDVGGLSLKYVASLQFIEYLKIITEHFESNYPEILRKCYVINASRSFQLLFSILKPVMSGKTIEKVKIMTKEEEWKPVLLDEIPADQLPECYGGTAWSNLHSFVGYKMKKDPESLIEYTVAPGDILRIPVDVPKENCTLKWNARIDSFDIDFYVTFNGDIVFPTEKIESTKASVGSLHCDSLGVFTFHFDNSYSRFRSKTLKYRIKVVE